MSQLTYDLYQPKLQAGDAALSHHETPRPFRASADVRAGRGVVASFAGALNDGSVSEPSGVGRRFYGVAQTRQSTAYSAVSGDLAYKAGEIVPVLLSGYVVVDVLGAVNPDGAVFMQLTGADAGKFSAGPAVAGSVFLVPGASFESVATAAGTAIVRLNPLGPAITV